VSNARLDLPEPGQPGDHDELVARDVDVDVLEVVLAGAADGDLVVLLAGGGSAGGGGWHGRHLLASSGA
jgi:hypothetical protein